MPDMSTYHYAYNDPITNIDMDGLIGIPCPGASSLGIALQKVGEAVTRAVSTIGSLSNLTVTAISAGLNVASKVGTQIDQNNRIGKQVGQQPKNKTVKEEEPTLNFDDLWKNYPKKVEHKDKNHKDIYDNHCAINVSDALEKSGIKLKKYKGATCDNDGDNKKHALGAEQLANWLKKQKIKGLGEPEVYDGNTYLDKIK